MGLIKTMLRPGFLDVSGRLQLSSMSARAASVEPPVPSRGLLGDIYHYLLRRPVIPTHVAITDEASREHYGRRIASHIGTPVDEYAVLNVHRIGIDAPVEEIFAELRRRNATTACWPDHLAHVQRRAAPNGDTHVSVLGWKFWSLFRLTEVESDTFGGEARHLLFRSHGGYPIGIFAMLVRPSIRELGESSESQFFFVVSFDFYGQPHWWGAKFVHGLWEAIHNRATGNILNRFRQLCESEAQG